VPVHTEQARSFGPYPSKAPIDLVPRKVPLDFRPLDWPAVRRIALPRVAPPPAAEFASVLSERTSDRSIRRAPLRELANYLAFATLSKSSWGTAPIRTSRPTHFAGALHPVEIVIVAGSERRHVLRLDQTSGALDRLRPVARKPLGDLNGRITDMFPDARCDYLVLLADFALVEAHYVEPEMLIWRDAGALMQTLHLCATAYRLAFCPAGIRGHELAEALFGATFRVWSVGVAVVGRPAEE
jgi:hypothetical protein